MDLAVVNTSTGKRNHVQAIRSYCRRRQALRLLWSSSATEINRLVESPNWRKGQTEGGHLPRRYSGGSSVNRDGEVAAGSVKFYDGRRTGVEDCECSAPVTGGGGSKGHIDGATPAACDARATVVRLGEISAGHDRLNREIRSPGDRDGDHKSRARGADGLRRKGESHG